MYSGSDSTGSPNYSQSQWPLNPTAYQNMSNEQVDWAALAQQWILMKEAGPPPIPDSQNSSTKLTARGKDVENEGGEAPMDVENTKDGSTQVNASWGALSDQAPGTESWDWKSKQSWGWDSTWQSPAGLPPPSVLKAPLLPTPQNYNQFNVSPTEEIIENSSFPTGYNTTANTDFSSGGYWNTNNAKLKPHNSRYRKVNVPRTGTVNPSINLPQTSVPNESDTPAHLDLAKRKQLPAWIREGLEKMEREKVKQIEKEKEKQEQYKYDEKVKQNEKETMEILKTTIKERQKSQFDSDGEPSEGESKVKKKTSTPEYVAPLTQEELMLKVRRTMTEILLKVTSREIEAICTEERQRYIKKRKASDQRVSAPSGANIKAKLGLGAYGSDSESSSDDSSEEPDSHDSDAELKDIIKKRKADFVKTERDIENKLAEAESRKGGDKSRSSTPESNASENQVDARNVGKRTHNSPSPKRLHSRDSKPKRSSSSLSDERSDSESRLRRHRRSSSASTNNSYRKKVKRKDRSPSYTSEKKSKHSSKSSTKSKRSRTRSPESKKISRRDSERSRSKKSSRSPSNSRSSRRSRSSSYRRSSRRSDDRRSRSRTRKSRSRSFTRSKRRSRSRSKSTRYSRRDRSRSSSGGRGKKSRRY